MNLIILTVDALRKESLACYNKEDGISTGFKEFYDKSIIFDHMFITIPETYPSLGSLFTGLYPFNHKIAQEPYDRNKLTLFDYLKNTHSLLIFTTEPPLGESLTYEEYKEYNLELEKGRTNLRKDHIDVSRLLSYIEKNKNRDFFFTTHFWRPRKYGIKKDYEFRELLKEKKYEEKKYEKIWNDSLKLVKDVGIAIRKIFNTLKFFNLLEKTIVVITADHGDYYSAEKNIKGFHPLRPEIDVPAIKHTELHFNPVINIPFFLYHPKLKPEKISQPISIIDIMPTLLDFFEKPLKTQIDGMSLANFLEKKKQFDFKDIFVDRSVTSQMYTIIDQEGWKLTSYLGKFKNLLLYNIFDDPEELNDLADKKINIVKKLLKKLYKFPIDSFVKKEDIIFRYLNYKNIDYVKNIFNKFEIDNWEKIAPNFNKIKWANDSKLLKEINSEIPKDKGSKILEIGIGTGIVSKFIKKNYPSFDVSGIDLSPSMLSYIKSDEIEIETGDAHRLAFLNNSLDIIIMRNVLKFLENPKLVFKEIFRVLKKNGIFVLVEETPQEKEFFENWKKISKINLFRQKDILDLFHSSGFSADIKKEIKILNHSLNNYSLSYDRLKKKSIKRRYYDAPQEYKNIINFSIENDIRSGQPYGDVFVDIKFSIFKGGKNG